MPLEEWKRLRHFRVRAKRFSMVLCCRKRVVDRLIVGSGLSVLELLLFSFSGSWSVMSETSGLAYENILSHPRKAALKTHAFQTLARVTSRMKWREAFGMRASSAPLFPRLRHQK